MINKVIIHGLIAWLAAAAAGCTDNRDAREEAVALRFRAVLEQNSRGGAANPCAYPADIPFGVWALSLPGDRKWDDHADRAEMFLDDCRATWSGEAWTTDTPCHWPPDKRRATFFAYSPCSFPAVFSTERGIEFKGFDLATDTADLMFAGPIADRSGGTSGGTVQVPFARALCAVDFRVQTPVPEGTVIRLRRLALEGVAFKGDFRSLPEPAWSVTGDTGEAVFFEGDLTLDETEQAAGKPLFMLPQRARVTVKATCDIEHGGNATTGRELKTDAVLTWGCGKRRGYTLKVTPDTLVFTTDILKP
ncbi:fimbrillin family protein [Butyricimonas sp.]|uniref:fimbrillin family protein n=1 Tax=Butyricimonas sp. TaxID=1969738 RepID=UPI0025BAC45B|nr:fimbrillin family protein [Butyricimonas sp.]